MGPRGAALTATLALRRDRRRGSRRGRDARLRGFLLRLVLRGGLGLCGDLLGLLRERAADGGDAGESAEVVATAGELGLALPEHADERCGEEDRRVGAEPDPDEESKGEVLERVAAEEVERGDREHRDEGGREGPRSTSHSETFLMTRKDARRISGTFSRIRSNTMMVSYIE
jgi:hypothetical protein